MKLVEPDREVEASAGDCLVEFVDAGVQVHAPSGYTLLDAARMAGVAMPHVCLGNCACLSCCVEVVFGRGFLSAMDQPERDRLNTAPGLPTHARLACQALVRPGRVVVRRLRDPIREW
ncbi:MAG: 2Fe-2S iron-sulfur cluster-binding protein [Armatimonadetes bacterium]|nr:2Fe-2S iron-sulfur cluster-binding protein [Armatimonadota bacterium]